MAREIEHAPEIDGKTSEKRNRSRAFCTWCDSLDKQATR